MFDPKMMFDPNRFPALIEDMLSSLRNKKQVCCPKNFKSQRMHSQENLMELLQNSVDKETFEKSLLNERFSFFTYFEKESDDSLTITKCTLSAIVSKNPRNTLIDLYNHRDIEDGIKKMKVSQSLQYYRLDFDMNEPLDPFSHPHIHVHTCPNGEPRFPFLHNDKFPYIILAFIEFIYLNHFYDEWYRWVLENISESKTIIDISRKDHLSAAERDDGEYIRKFKEFKGKLSEKKGNIFVHYDLNEYPTLKEISPDLLYYTDSKISSNESS